MVGYRRRTFIWATACAAVIWASYAFLIGRIGGRIFADRPLLGLLLALGLALVISGLIEVVRRLRPWRLITGGRNDPGTHPPAGDTGSGAGDGRAGVAGGSRSMPPCPPWPRRPGGILRRSRA